MKVRLTTHVEHGSKNDHGYVDEMHRKCEKCKAVKIRHLFYYKANGEVTVDCRACIESHKKKVHADRAKQKAQQ